MDWKLVSAFSTGAILASGIVFFAVKQDTSPAPMPAPPPVQLRAAQDSAPATPPKLPQIAATRPAAIPTPVIPHERVHLPIREKPSPMPPPVRSVAPIVTAHNDSPSPQPARTAEIAPPPQPTAPPPTSAQAPVPLQNVSLPRKAPKPEPAPDPQPTARVPHVVTLPAGTLLAVRIGETISSDHFRLGDKFLATLTRPLVLGGFIIADRGERAEGRVVQTAAGSLSISLVRLATDDRQILQIQTDPYVMNNSDLWLTRGRPAEIPVESHITFRVQNSMTITERLD